MPPRKEVTKVDKSPSVEEATPTTEDSVKDKETSTQDTKSPSVKEKSPSVKEDSPVKEKVKETEPEKNKTPTKIITPNKNKTPLSVSIATPRSAKKPVVENNVLPKNKKYNTKFCDESMTYEQCEMTILRHYVDKNEHIAVIKDIKSQDVENMTKLLEDYLKEAQLVCYGGTAINNILSPKYQFYDDDYDVPDYDFYSPNPTEDAKRIADMYAKAGYKEVEAKAGVHPGTVKVFVQGIGIADVTFLDHPLFEKIQADAIKDKKGILYAPPDFLRMNMYIELSRPQGHVGRWEKVLKRLNLLNQEFPVKKKTCPTKKEEIRNETGKKTTEDVIRDVIIADKGVFFGGYAASLYSGYMSKDKQAFASSSPEDVDAIVEDIDATAARAVKALEDADFEDVDSEQVDPVGELIAASVEIRVGGQTVCTLFAPLGCQNFNYTVINKKNVRVATIDTILCMYLAFYYGGSDTYDKDRIMCTVYQMFNVQADSKLIQKDILKRFNSSCIGTQPTMNDMKNEKLEKAKEYLKKPKDAEYEKYFFKYTPGSTVTEKDAKTEEPSTVTKETREPIPPVIKDTTPVTGKDGSAKKGTPRFREEEEPVYVPRRPKYKQWNTNKYTRGHKSRRPYYTRRDSALYEAKRLEAKRLEAKRLEAKRLEAKRLEAKRPEAIQSYVEDRSPVTQKRRKKRKNRKTAKRDNGMRLSFL